jgi:phosphate transport system substrate-binding protein
MIVNLKHSIFKFAALMGLLFLVVLSCRREQKDNEKETILEGTAIVLTDESILPIVEDQQAVFESQYKAKIKLIGKPESEIVNMLMGKKAAIAILSRKLTKEESAVYENLGITPRITVFATDAIVLITNKKSTDTIADLQDVIDLMQGKPSKIKGLVFDNPNSSTVRYMDSIAGVEKGEKKNIYSLKSHDEVLKYIADHPDLIGVVGLNSIVQPNPEWQSDTDKVKVMGVRNVKNKSGDNFYYKPSQSNIAKGSYPLLRKLYVLNYQGGAGLGMGFASFVAGEIGQRIVLKSGLMPIRVPGRNVTIRKEIINNDKKK